MIPFVALSFYTGPMTQLIGGADIAFAVGLIVASLVYWLMSYQLNLHAEKAAISESQQLLEEVSYE